MRRYAGDERGGALLYVLLIALLLTIMTPVILEHTMTTYMAQSQMNHEARVSQLAISGMEAFLHYVYNIDGEDHFIDLLMAYEGWGTATLMLPDNTTMTLGQTFLDAAGEATMDWTQAVQVVVTARSGSEKFAREKSIVYGVQLTAGSCEIIDPDGSRYPVKTEHYDHILVHQPTAEETPNDITPNVAPLTIPVSGLTGAMQSYFDEVFQRVQQTINEYKTDVVYCATCADLSSGALIAHLEAIIDQHTSTVEDPLVLRVPSLELPRNTTVTLGTPAKPVILIVDQFIVDNQNTVLNVYGSLLLPGSVELNRSFQLNVYDVSGAFGDLLREGSMRYAGGGSGFVVNVANRYYGKDHAFQTSTALTAKHIWLGGKVDVFDTDVNLEAEQETLVEAVHVQRNHASFQVGEGDLMILRDLETSANHTRLSAGGMIAIGGNVRVLAQQYSIVSGRNGTTVIDYESAQGEGTPGACSGESMFRLVRPGSVNVP